jgi:hypothetical protein
MGQAIIYLLGAGALFFLGVTVFPELSKNRCLDRWKESGLAARYESQWTGCMVQIDGRWIPEANVQIRSRISN